MAVNLGGFAFLLTVAGSIGMAVISLFVTAVHYPMFRLVPEDAFCLVHRRHCLVIGLIVVPLMLAELLGAIWLMFLQRGWVNALGVGLAAFSFSWSFLVSARHHERLASGLDYETVDRLVQTSWPRTWAWLLHAGLRLAQWSAILLTLTPRMQ